MLHLDIKRLGKIDGVGHRKAGTRQVRRRRPGWEYLHVCVDDASRAAYTAILPDEKAESAIEFYGMRWHGTPRTASRWSVYSRTTAPAANPGSFVMPVANLV